MGDDRRTIDMRIKGYLGPDYDGNGLEKAREMIKQTMVTFPDAPHDLVLGMPERVTGLIMDFIRENG